MFYPDQLGGELLPPKPLKVPPKLSCTENFTEYYLLALNRSVRDVGRSREILCPAVLAVKRCLKSIVVTLQELHVDAGDLSSEAGGLLLTFQDHNSTILIFALCEILAPINMLMLTLQSAKLSLSDLPAKVEAAVSRLQEIEQNPSTYMHYFADYVDNCAYPLIGVETESSVDSAVVPYIKALLKNIERRFGDSMMNKLNNISIAVNIFDPTNKTDSNHDSDDKLAALIVYCFQPPSRRCYD